MNLFAWIIVLTILLEYFLNLLADFLNLNSMSLDIPAEFKKIYDPKKYELSQRYNREKTRFGFVSTTFDLLVLLSFWFLGGFNYVDQIVRGFSLSNTVTGVVYIGILLFLTSLLNIPFRIYSIFVIEEKYGFNKMTWKIFISDMVKGILLSLILGTPILYLVLWFFEFSGPLSWLYIWVVITAFSVLLQFIAPIWIMPLFNKFQPMPDGPLKKAILNYARSVSFALKDVFIIDGSKRSSKANAFFTGFGKNKRVALYDTLLEKQSTEEVVGVLAHEVGHYKKKHIIKGMLISILHMGVLLYLLSRFLENRMLFEAFYMQEVSIYASLIFFTMLFSPIEMILSVIMGVFSRKHEYEADYFAATTLKTPEPLISSLKKLTVDHLSNLTPHPVYVFLHYSHPPVLQRIKALSAAVKNPVKNSGAGSLKASKAAGLKPVKSPGAKTKKVTKKPEGKSVKKPVPKPASKKASSKSSSKAPKTPGSNLKKGKGKTTAKKPVSAQNKSKNNTTAKNKIKSQKKK